MRNCDDRLTAITESHCSGFMLASNLSRVMPALWISTSRPSVCAAR